MKTAHQGQDTRVEIAVPGNIITKVLNGGFCGGLILCDKQQFDTLKAEMELQAAEEKH